MKIEKITLCNLTSIEGEQTIDFTEEPLRSAGLFAITGDMGSGKSTILDAICLALYNKAPRFENIETIKSEEMKLVEDKAQQVQPKNTASILRRGQKLGYVCVTFSTNNGERYEATWTTRITKTGNYKTPERTLQQLAPHKEVVDKGEVQQRIEQAIGLTYDQFTRTVILAQNSFANFLRAKADDKAALLEKLTGTEVYSNVSQRIFRLSQEADARVHSIEDEMKGLLHTRLDEHLLAEQQERAHLLEASSKNAVQNVKRMEQQIDWIDRFAQQARQVQQCEAQFSQTTKACMEARADEMKLDRYDAVLDMQPLYQEIKMRRADVDKIKSSEAENATQLEETRKALDKQSTALDVAHERTSDAERQLEVRRPAIDRGHTLSGEIKMANDQLKRLEEQLVLATQSYEKRQSALVSKQEALHKLAEGIKQKQLHKQSLEVHQLMFQKFDLIKDKLSNLYNETRHNVECHTKAAHLQKRQLELREQGERAEEEQHNNQARLNALKSELLIHQQANHGHDSVKLQQTAANNRSRLVSLSRAAVLWQHISDGYARIAEKTATQRRETTELAQKQQEANKMEIALHASEEAFARISATYTLSQSKDIVQLRKQLKEGIACPVCGATHHPYHTETERELGNLLSSMSKEFNNLKEDVLLKRSQLSDLREEMAADSARIAADEVALNEFKERQAADVDEWKAFANLDPSFADCSATVNREARRMMIQLLIDNTTRSADEAEQELSTYNEHQFLINRLNTEIDELNGLMANNRTYLDKLRTEANVAATTAEELQHVIVLSDRACSELYTDLDEMITLSGWFTEWKNNADGLRIRLTNLHHDWQQTCAALDEAERTDAILREEIKGAETNIAEEQRHVVQCRDSRDATREELTRKQEDLRRIMGENTPQKEAEMLQTAISNAREVENATRRQFEEIQGQLHLLEGKRNNLLKNRLESQQQQQQKQQELDLLILRFNGTHSPVQFTELDQIFTAKTDWKAMRNRIDQLKEQRVLAQNNLEMAQKALQTLQAEAVRPSLSVKNIGVPNGNIGENMVSTNNAAVQQSAPTASVATSPTAQPTIVADLEAYLALRQTLSGELEKQQHQSKELAEELTNVKLKLQAHQQSVASANRMQQTLDAALEDAREWNRLNTLFGAADGKKFRTLAQSYTFSYLVAHANRHLCQLSPRYELHNIEGTLALEIIDHDMFDEHRYVTSLSGGETFVVSLALALGLASMSSNQLVIGSLFIDEGFGNLDRDSLDLVMLALSNLENAQGRKVGVISHTEQIRSQISPQIKIRKRPGGSSSVIEVI